MSRETQAAYLRQKSDLSVFRDFVKGNYLLQNLLAFRERSAWPPENQKSTNFLERTERTDASATQVCPVLVLSVAYVATINLRL